MCPECGLNLSQYHEHRCGVPILTKAAGVELTPLEQRYVRWLAGWDQETIDVFARLFWRCRSETAVSDAEPPTLAEAVEEWNNSDGFGECFPDECVVALHVLAAEYMHLIDPEASASDLTHQGVELVKRIADAKRLGVKDRLSSLRIIREHCEHEEARIAHHVAPWRR